MKTVFILLDAFRHDYISKANTPFLWNCAESGSYIQHVIPSYGFCERTEILTGQKPDESGFFTAIGFDPKNSPYKNIKYLQTAGFIEQYIPGHIKIPLMSKDVFPRQIFRRIISKLFLRKHNIKMSPYQIPFAFLPFFNLTEDKIDHREKNAFSSASILQLLEQKGKKYFYDSFTALGLPQNGSDDDRMQLALENAANKNTELFLIYISLPDALGHKYGPDSTELKQACKELDHKLKKFTKEFAHDKEDVRFIFVGDHGMIPVTKSVNIHKEINKLAKELKLVYKKDYIFFLDSTMLRIWFTSDLANKNFTNALRKSQLLIETGFFMDEAFALKYHLPWKDKRYGDIIWLANKGVLVNPDFFHNHDYVPKGMHGYDPNCPESHGMCIIYNSAVPERQIVSQTELTDIFDILNNNLNKEGK